MATNVGGYDRIARFIVGPLLIVVALAAVAGLFAMPVGGIWAQIIVLLVGLVITYTAAVRYCQFNELLGVNTAK